jgi:hypothetical protein
MSGASAIGVKRINGGMRGAELGVFRMSGHGHVYDHDHPSLAG